MPSQLLSCPWEELEVTWPRKTRESRWLHRPPRYAFKSDKTSFLTALLLVLISYNCLLLSFGGIVLFPSVFYFFLWPACWSTSSPFDRAILPPQTSEWTLLINVLNFQINWFQTWLYCCLFRPLFFCRRTPFPLILPLPSLPSPQTLLLLPSWLVLPPLDLSSLSRVQLMAPLTMDWSFSWPQRPLPLSATPNSELLS